MKTIYFCFACTLVLLNLFQSGSSQLDPEKEALIQQLVQNVFIPANKVTGLSLSIVQNGETILSKGYGHQNIEAGIPATNRTLFSIGSVTKSFIGTLVVKVLSEKYPEAGESILDVPVTKLVTNFNFTLSDRNRAESTSFRDLLAHRTCLRSTDIEIIFGSMNYDSNREFNYRTRYETEGCSFRNGFVYNNALYVLAGELIANIAGKSIEELVREFMAEIGMVDSTTIDVSGSYERNPLMSQAYVIKAGQIIRFNQTLLRRNDVALGAGGILSTSNDMAKYGLFHLNQGRVGDKQVISKEAMSWLSKGSNPIPTFSGKGMYAYGLGLGLVLTNGEQWISHDGFWPPYLTMFSYLPVSNISLYICTNGPGYLIGSYTQEYVFIEILNILRGISAKNQIGLAQPIAISEPEFTLQNLKQNARKKNMATKIENRRSRIEFSEVIGVYGDELAGDLTIDYDPLDNRTLQMNLGRWGIGRLFPTSNPVQFEIFWQTDLLHHFYSYPTPVPSFQADFGIEDSIVIMTDHVGVVVFRKGHTLETYPSIPWAPDSCGPKGTFPMRH